MKKRTLKKLASLTLVMAALLCMAIPAGASETPQVEATLLLATVDYPEGVFARMTTSYYEPRNVWVENSVTPHVIHMSDMIYIPAPSQYWDRSYGNFDCYVEQQLGSILNDLANDGMDILAERLGVREEVSFYVSSGYGEVIPDEWETGSYQVKVVFERRSVYKEIVGYKTSSHRTIWDDSVLYAPKIPAYRVVEKVS